VTIGFKLWLQIRAYKFLIFLTLKSKNTMESFLPNVQLMKDGHCIVVGFSTCLSVVVLCLLTAYSFYSLVQFKKKYNGQ